MNKIFPDPKPGAKGSRNEISCSAFESEGVSRQAACDAVRKIQSEILRSDQLSAAFGNGVPSPLSLRQPANKDFEMNSPQRAAQLLSLDVSIGLASFIHERLAVSQSEIFDSPCSPLPLLALALVYQ